MVFPRYVNACDLQWRVGTPSFKGRSNTPFKSLPCKGAPASGDGAGENCPHLPPLFVSLGRSIGGGGGSESRVVRGSEVIGGGGRDRLPEVETDDANDS